MCLKIEIRPWKHRDLSNDNGLFGGFFCMDFSWGFDGDNVKMGCEMGYHGITDTTGCTGIQPDNGIQGDVYIYISTYVHYVTTNMI